MCPFVMSSNSFIFGMSNSPEMTAQNKLFSFLLSTFWTKHFIPRWVPTPQMEATYKHPTSLVSKGSKLQNWKSQQAVKRRVQKRKKHRHRTASSSPPRRRLCPISRLNQRRNSFRDKHFKLALPSGIKHIARWRASAPTGTSTRPPSSARSTRRCWRRRGSSSRPRMSSERRAASTRDTHTR